MPWDRKVPKTRLCGPCCWKKFRRPFEPFYTWWRHENYFTWVFCPYRNEQLSRGERALIVVCSLYITFYVLFIIVMLRDSWGADITIFTSVKILALNSKIQLDEFEKHYDSNISAVFHALARSVTKRRHHEKHEHEDDSENEGGDSRSPRPTLTTRQSSESSSDGETMWVFDTPAQRLERRAEERLQRKRAFRVLKDYNIESVGPSSEPASAPSALTPSGPKLRRQDTRRIPLLPTRNKAEAPREEDFVILMPDVHSKSDKNNRDNLDTVANGRVEDDYDDQQDSDYFSSDLERGHSRSASSSQAASANRVYAVTERRKTLLRRVSTSAEAFAAWALDYDPKAAHQL
ncbi:hypothetical protein AM587_10015668 [Phytophthora nicotianae]|uniref:Uncharacterized protein n=1 Tax=Phytophthora nicotianae TaxID=4792 RepID=A0A0W8BW03_PHYNI|nr:hypothetical protein AM587_10015668 [Phytophthora nicotianae]